MACECCNAGDCGPAWLLKEMSALTRFAVTTECAHIFLRLAWTTHFIAVGRMWWHVTTASATSGPTYIHRLDVMPFRKTEALVLREPATGRTLSSARACWSRLAGRTSW
eukprot:7802653-Karenia_brevis.AAC.1